MEILKRVERRREEGGGIVRQKSRCTYNHGLKKKRGS